MDTEDNFEPSFYEETVEARDVDVNLGLDDSRMGLLQEGSLNDTQDPLTFINAVSTPIPPIKSCIICQTDTGECVAVVSKGIETLVNQCAVFLVSMTYCRL